MTESIGVRLAGSEEEKAAAGYIADRFAEAGAAVSVEEFPVKERRVIEQQLALRIGSRWTSFPCSLLSSVPGTDGKVVRAPLVFFDSHTEYRRKDLSHLKGRAVLHLGTHIETVEHYRRLVESEPAFVILVDTRYPGEVPPADGMFPAYTRAYGAVPMVSAAYRDAWRWKAERFEEARLRVSGGMRLSGSQNVVAVLAGADASAEPGILFAGGHHDTQADSVGADDNAVGVAAVIELARLLAPLPRRRELRLISFGAEEQLSVGSAEYVRRHRGEIAERGRFMFNFDAFGSYLGWSVLNCIGSDGMTAYLADRFEERGIYVKTSTELIPYADHFPFVAAGIPSAWLGRKNCEAGRFFHHRPDDDITRIDPGIAASQIEAAADVLIALMQEENPPFPLFVPEKQSRGAAKIWKSLFGGWLD